MQSNVDLGPVEDIAKTLAIASKPKEIIDDDSKFDNIATNIVNLAPIDLNSVKLDEFLLRNLKPAAIPIFK